MLAAIVEGPVSRMPIPIDRHDPVCLASEEERPFEREYPITGTHDVKT